MKSLLRNNNKMKTSLNKFVVFCGTNAISGYFNTDQWEPWNIFWRYNPDKKLKPFVKLQPFGIFISNFWVFSTQICENYEVSY